MVGGFRREIADRNLNNPLAVLLDERKPNSSLAAMRRDRPADNIDGFGQFVAASGRQLR